MRLLGQRLFPKIPHPLSNLLFNLHNGAVPPETLPSAVFLFELAVFRVLFVQLSLVLCLLFSISFSLRTS